MRGGKAEDKAFAHARLAALGTCAMLVAVSLATPFLAPQYYARWFTMPMLAFAAPVPLVTGCLALLLLTGLARRKAWRAFLSALGIFVLGMIGLGISMWPYVVPQSVTIWDAAAPERSQLFMLVGVAVIMPLILAYTGWAYWVFRGKVGEHGYH